MQVKITLSQDDTTRAIVRFDQTAIRSVVGEGTLTGATLELPWKEAGTDPAGNDIYVHRLLKRWSEGSVTWKCGEDLDLSNVRTDCPETGWKMSGTNMNAFHPAQTARVHLDPGETGLARFDVTADVHAFLAGEIHHGWLVNPATPTSRAVFWSRESATKPKLVLAVQRQQSLPPEAPDLIPDWMYSDTNVAANGSASITAPFTKRIVVVQFQPGIALAEREAAINAVEGSVVGGIRIAGGEGHYYLRIEDVEGATLLSKAAELRAMPQVANAFVNVAGRAQYRRPNDGAGWRKQDWAVLPSPLDASRRTWAQTATNAPLAWGCTTGDNSTPIAVVDVDFRVTPTNPNLFRDLQRMSRMTAEGHLAEDGHGAGVAGLIAAKGDNNEEMTGVMWDADVRLYDFGVYQEPVDPVPGAVFASAISVSVENAADDGAKIINISSGVIHGLLPVGQGTPGQRAARDEMSLALFGALTALAQRGHRPLVVLSAGNNAIDAGWNGFPLVRSSFPDQILTVGGTTASGAFWDDGVGVGSNTGIFVDVVAPGKGVYRFVGSGAIEPDNGTSFAAPLVSGIAGLLLSFDPDLTSAQVRKLILDGAQRANRTVIHDGRTYYLADAYESLKLAAEKPGTPLCGNRVWSQDGTVRVQRGTDVEQLFSTGGPAGFLNVFHGGNRIDWADQNYDEHSTVRAGLDWRQVDDAERPNLPGDAPGGTYYSLGAQEGGWFYSSTHDHDKLIRARTTYLSSRASDVAVQISVDGGTSWTTDTTARYTTHDGTDFKYYYRRAKFGDDGETFIEWVNDSVAAGVHRIASGQVRFYPQGGKALLQEDIRQHTTTILTQVFEKCPWATVINGVNSEECRSVRDETADYETRLYEVDLTTHESRLILSVPGRQVSASAVSEAQDQLMLVVYKQRHGYDTTPRVDGTPGYIHTNSHSTVDRCQASWWSLPALPGAPAERHRVLTPDMCFSAYGGGTIAPVRMKVAASSFGVPGMLGWPPVAE